MAVMADVLVIVLARLLFLDLALEVLDLVAVMSTNLRPN